MMSDELSMSDELLQYAQPTPPLSGPSLQLGAGMRQRLDR